jgi:hypothetical protein
MMMTMSRIHIGLSLQVVGAPNDYSGTGPVQIRRKL